MSDTFHSGKSSAKPIPPYDLTFLACSHLYIENEGAEGAGPRMFAETPSKFYLMNQEVELTFDHGVPGSLEVVDNMGGALFMRVPGAGTQTPYRGASKSAEPSRSPP